MIPSNISANCLYYLKLMNYKEMDQTHWVCYELPGKGYYYGEVALLDESGVVQSKDSPEAANPKNKLVKHGFGIYIYPSSEGHAPTRYEGNWDRDRKHGQGKLTAPGQFTYEGQFKDGSYHEQGKMSWANGDAYEGAWKKGRMEGGGIFRHHEGFVLKGSFKANLFLDDGLLRNPQMGEKEYSVFKKQRKEVLRQKERNQKVKHGFVTKLPLSELHSLPELCTKSNHNNRVPLIISSEAAHFNLQSLEQHLGSIGAFHSFDLRKASQLSGEARFNYKAQLGEMTRSVLKNGGVLAINLDESQVQYKEAFYPELRQFYDSAGFNNNTWSRDLLKRKEVVEKVIGNSELSNSYLLAVWSKVKLAEELNEERIREKLQLRFETILPFIKIDIIFIVSK